MKFKTNEHITKLDKLGSDIDMQYNKIIGFAWGPQSTIGPPLASIG